MSLKPHRKTIGIGAGQDNSANETNITLHKGQSDVYAYLFRRHNQKQLRHALVVASRGFGKSYLAATIAVSAARELEALPPNVLNKNIAIIAASYDQTMNIYQPLLSYVFNLDKIATQTKKPLTYRFPNNTVISCWSADAINKLRGTGQYLVIADEMSTWKVTGSSIKDAWESVIQPCVTSRWDPDNSDWIGAPSAGRTMIITTLQGRDFIFDLTTRPETNPNWRYFKYTYKDSPLLSNEEIERVKKDMDPLLFAREYECDFGESGLNVFKVFSRERNVRRDLPYWGDDETIYAAIDFNLMLNATSFSAIRNNELHVLEEHQGSPDTQTLAKFIKEKFPDRNIICYPDPAGGRGHTSSSIGKTDFSILREAGLQVCAKPRAPSLVDSANAVNRKLLNAKDETTLFVHPRCSGVIKSFERTLWKESTPDIATIDKKQGTEHFTDGIRYLVDYIWPVANQLKVIQTKHFF